MAIFPSKFQYFEKSIWYIYWKSETDLNLLFTNFHKNFFRNEILENNLFFVPHITLFRIIFPEIYEKHRKNIEQIIERELKKVEEIDISNKRIYLYKVNSNFPWEIQIKQE